jgi:hypothetical protein
MGNLADTVRRFKTGTYVVTRRTPVAHVKGRAQPPTTAAINVDACVQPASGRQLQRLPDGMRDSEAIALWCEVELKTKTTTTLPDLIAYRGASYEVQLVKPYDELAGFFEVVAIKVGA